MIPSALAAQSLRIGWNPEVSGDEGVGAVPREVLQFPGRHLGAPPNNP